MILKGYFSFWTTSNSVSVEPSKVELFRLPSESLWARASDELSSCLPSSMKSSLSWGSDISALSFLRIAFYWISMHVLWKNAKDHREIIFTSRVLCFSASRDYSPFAHTFHDESTPPLNRCSGGGIRSSWLWLVSFMTKESSSSTVKNELPQQTWRTQTTVATTITNNKNGLFLCNNHYAKYQHKAYCLNHCY
jgi:hypothetical protein